MVILVQFNPKLAKSTLNDVLPKRTSVRGSLHNPAGRSGSISSRRSITTSSQNVTSPDFDADEDDEEVQAGHNFTYIPPNPKKYYRRLLELCLDVDLAAMHDPNVNDDDQVSLGILSYLVERLIKGLPLVNRYYLAMQEFFKSDVTLLSPAMVKARFFNCSGGRCVGNVTRNIHSGGERNLLVAVATDGNPPVRDVEV